MEEVKHHIPSELISDILSRLPIESLMRCKSVCRSWFSLIEDRSFVELQFQRSKNRLPGLIIWDSHYTHKLLLLDRDKGREDMWKAKDIVMDYTWKYGEEEGELNFHIVGSCNGLLCMSSSFRYGCCSMLYGIFICNPVTKECVMFPVGSGHYYSAGLIGFGVDSTGKYKVGTILKKRGIDGVVDYPVLKDKIITIGESSWREIWIPNRSDYNYGNTEHFYPAEKMVFMNGALYCIIRKPRPIILVFDLDEEKFWNIEFHQSIEFPFHNYGNPPRLRLTEIKGSLDVHHRLDASIPRWIMEINKSKCYKFYQCDPINVAVTWPNIYVYFDLVAFVGMLSNDLLLYRADDKMGSSHLLVYCNEKKQFMRVSGAGPRLWFEGNSFVPSLLSPIAIACGKTEKDTTRFRLRGLHLEVVGYSSFWELIDSCRLHPIFRSLMYTCSPHCKRRNGRSNSKRRRQSLSITTNMHSDPPSIL